VDQATFQRLVQLAGNPRDLVRTHTLAAQDVEGPFETIPEDIYAKAKLSCMCYENLSEKLAETFHTTPELLEKLNPNVDLNTLQAGGRLNVPNVRDQNAGTGLQIARLEVSDGGYFLHALDASGKIVYHFPTTLGSQYSPSPDGELKVTNVVQDPTWHYQPDILHGVDDADEEALIPAGPNNSVGVVWMALSKEHFGIHGTSAPETIGYTTSNGCVRLTNWDARFLSQRIREGVPVRFRDVDAARGQTAQG
jgi:lipoprotein-anchoring transpeptidase ErfK/SrfK